MKAKRGFQGDNTDNILLTSLGIHGTNFRSMKSFGHFLLPIVNSDYIIVSVDLIFTGFGDINRMSIGMRKIFRGKQPEKV